MKQKYLRARRGIEFISYDGNFPCYCHGTLHIRVNGFGYHLEHAVIPALPEWMGGKVDGQFWKVINLPDVLFVYRNDIEELVNEHLPHGCCGGCL